MDDRGEMTDQTHRILKDAIRYGVLFHVHLGGEIPVHDYGQSVAFGLTGLLSFIIGAPFALRRSTERRSATAPRSSPNCPRPDFGPVCIWATEANNWVSWRSTQYERHANGRQIHEDPSPRHRQRP